MHKDHKQGSNASCMVGFWLQHDIMHACIPVSADFRLVIQLLGRPDGYKHTTWTQPTLVFTMTLLTPSVSDFSLNLLLDQDSNLIQKMGWYSKISCVQKELPIWLHPTLLFAPFNLVPWKNLLTYPGHFLQAGTPKELGCKMKLQFDELWIGKSNLEIGSSIPKQSPNFVDTHCGNLLLFNGYGSLHLSGYENLLLRSNEDRLNAY